MKTLSDLYISNKLVDINTGELVGFILTGDYASVALTLDKIKELDTDLGSWIEYADTDIVEVAAYQGRYGLIVSSHGFQRDLEDIPFEKVDNDNFVIYGYLFKSYMIVSLNSDVALRNSLSEEPIL